MKIKVVTNNRKMRASLKSGSYGHRQFIGELKKALRTAGIELPAGTKIIEVEIHEG